MDDLIATGGTALAGFDLVDQLGATVHEFAAMITLPFLDGVGKIHAYKEGKYKVREIAHVSLVYCTRATYFLTEVHT